jgi:hypothetical protein
MSECTESGCVEAGRWLVGERRYCSTHGIQASIRGSASMRLVCQIVEEYTPLVRHTVWDGIEAELEAVKLGSADERGRLRAVARAAIIYGREVSK